MSLNSIIVSQCFTSVTEIQSRWIFYHLRKEPMLCVCVFLSSNGRFMPLQLCLKAIFWPDITGTQSFQCCWIVILNRFQWVGLNTIGGWFIVSKQSVNPVLFELDPGQSDNLMFTGWSCNCLTWNTCFVWHAVCVCACVCINLLMRTLFGIHHKYDIWCSLSSGLTLFISFSTSLRVDMVPVTGSHTDSFSIWFGGKAKPACLPGILYPLSFIIVSKGHLFLDAWRSLLTFISNGKF